MMQFFSCSIGSSHAPAAGDRIKSDSETTALYSENCRIQKLMVVFKN